MYYIDDRGCYRRDEFARAGAAFKLYIYNDSDINNISINSVEDDEIIIDFVNQILYINDVTYDLTQCSPNNLNIYPKIKKVIGFRMG